MSFFDTVEFVCPNCKTTIKIVSHAYINDFESFKSQNVPIAIAGDILNQPVVCSNCLSSYRVRSQVLPERVSMLLEKELKSPQKPVKD